MIKIVSESSVRMIVAGKLNGKTAYFLIDTGAVHGLIDKWAVKKFDISVDRRRELQMVGAGGSFKSYVVLTPLELAGRKVYQFCTADISGVVASIQRETGIKIAGLIGLNQCRNLHISIDTDDHYISLE